MCVCADSLHKFPPRDHTLQLHIPKAVTANPNATQVLCAHTYSCRQIELETPPASVATSPSASLLCRRPRLPSSSHEKMHSMFSTAPRSLLTWFFVRAASTKDTTIPRVRQHMATKHTCTLSSALTTWCTTTIRLKRDGHDTDHAIGSQTPSVVCSSLHERGGASTPLTVKRLRSSAGNEPCRPVSITPICPSCSATSRKHHAPSG